MHIKTNKLIFRAMYIYHRIIDFIVLYYCLLRGE